MKTLEIRTNVKCYGTVTDVLNAEFHVKIFLVRIVEPSYASWCFRTINFENGGSPDFPTVFIDNIEAESDDDADEGAKPKVGSHS